MEWVDQVVAAIVALLVAQLPDRLTAINADRADAVLLVMPRSDDVWPCDKWMPPTLPSIEVICNDSTRVDENESPKRYRHSITAVVTIEGTDEVAIDVEIKRFMLAMLLTLDNASLTTYGVTSGTPLRCGSINYDLLVPPQEDGRPWVRTALIDVSTETLL